MQNTVRWFSDQFQTTHIWNPWSNKTDTNLEFCYSSQFSSLWGFSVTRFDYNGAKKSHDLLKIQGLSLVENLFVKKNPWICSPV